MDFTVGLRRQLLAVGALTLILPLAAVQYVKEVESILRQGQANALQATAQAVASRIVEDRDLLLPLDTRAGQISGLPDIWFTPILKTPLVLDGYLDDWEAAEVPLTPCRPEVDHALHALCGVARSQDFVYLSVRVYDASRQYFNPAEGFLRSDHLVMRLGSEQVAREILIHSAAAGSAHVLQRTSEGQYLAEHRIRAIWNEDGESYTVELEVPLAWLNRSLGVYPVDGSAEGVGASVAVKSPAPVEMVLQDDELRQVLRVFRRDGVRLYVLLDKKWVVADFADPRVEPEGLQLNWRKWLIKKIVGEVDYPAWREPLHNGQMPTDWLTDPSKMAVSWWNSGGETIARVAVPLDSYGASAGIYVVAEQSTDSVESLTSGAIGQLLWYSLLASFAVASVLLAFATLLSFRVRRLNSQVHAAVDGQGRIKTSFAPSRFNDELGALSRGYALVLKRLESYTHYLESLSQKLSHELRTPIAIVRSSLENLAFTVTDSSSKVYLQRATDGLDRLTGIFNAMGAAARIEQSIQSTDKERLDLTGLVNDLVQAYKAIYPAITIELLEGDAGPVYLDGSAELLAQMLDKLVENAADFTGVGGYIGLQVSHNERSATLAVSNKGPLLDESQKGKLFDSLVSFRNVESHTHHLGLGLYIVRLIAEFHGGRVTARNHPDGMHVIFEVALPVFA